MKKMKTAKAIAMLLCVVIMSTMTMGLAASANCTKAYDKDTLTVSVVSGKADVATAKLTKCKCTPVENQLMVWLNVQYKSGNNYIWNPGPNKDTYIYDKGTDIEKVNVSITEHYIQYAHALYYAQCGEAASGTYETQFDETWTR